MMSEILHREERRLNEFESEEAMSTLVQFETFEEKLADVAFRRKLVNNLQIFTDSMAFHMYNVNI